MKKLNNNGFVLAETLVVTVFLMVIFSMIYSNFYPLIGEYEKREVYDDVDGKYSIYWIKKLIEDSSYSITDANQKYNYNTYGYVRFECKDVSEDNEKRATCRSLVDTLEVDGCDKNGNGCNIFITRYRLGGKDGYIFKNKVKENLLVYQENCNGTSNNCKQKYITNCTKNGTSEEECKEKAQKKVFRGGLKEYIENLPDFSAASLNFAQFRVIASFKHREDNNNYYSYATTEVNRQDS